MTTKKRKGSPIAIEISETAVPVKITKLNIPHILELDTGNGDNKIVNMLIFDAWCVILKYLYLPHLIRCVLASKQFIPVIKGYFGQITFLNMETDLRPFCRSVWASELNHMLSFIDKMTLLKQINCIGYPKTHVSVVLCNIAWVRRREIDFNINSAGPQEEYDRYMLYGFSKYIVNLNLYNINNDYQYLNFKEAIKLKSLFLHSTKQNGSYNKQSPLVLPPTLQTLSLTGGYIEYHDDEPQGFINSQENQLEDLFLCRVALLHNVSLWESINNCKRLKRLHLHDIPGLKDGHLQILPTENLTEIEIVFGDGYDISYRALGRFINKCPNIDTLRFRAEKPQNKCHHYTINASKTLKLIEGLIEEYEPISTKHRLVVYLAILDLYHHGIRSYKFDIINIIITNIKPSMITDEHLLIKLVEFLERVEYHPPSAGKRLYFLESVISRILELNNNNRAVCGLRVHVLYYLQKYSEAIEHLPKVISTPHEWQDELNYLLRRHVNVLRYKETRDLFNKFCKLAMQHCPKIGDAFELARQCAGNQYGYLLEIGQ